MQWQWDWWYDIDKQTFLDSFLLSSVATIWFLYILIHTYTHISVQSWLIFCNMKLCSYMCTFGRTALTIFQADAIMSRLNMADYQKEGDQPTLLVTSDIVCLDNLCHHILARSRWNFYAVLWCLIRETCCFSLMCSIQLKLPWFFFIVERLHLCVMMLVWHLCRSS